MRTRIEELFHEVADLTVNTRLRYFVAQGALAQLEPKDTPCGPYRLGRLLGRGGMGTVYSAGRVDGEVAQRELIEAARPDPGARLKQAVRLSTIYREEAASPATRRRRPARPDPGCTPPRPLAVVGSQTSGQCLCPPAA